MKARTTRKEKVILTGLRMVSEGGFHASPMSELAARSGVAVGTIYHHFASKDDLLSSIYDYCRDRLSEAAVAGDDPKQNFSKRYDSFWKNLYQHFVKNPVEFSFISQYHHSPLAGKGGAFRKQATELFREGVKAGKFRKVNVDVLAELTLQSVSTGIHFSKGSSKLSSKELDELRDMAWTGIRK